MWNKTNVERPVLGFLYLPQQIQTSKHWPFFKIYELQNNLKNDALNDVRKPLLFLINLFFNLNSWYLHHLFLNGARGCRLIGLGTVFFCSNFMAR